MPRKEKSPAIRFDGAIEEERLPEAWDAANELPMLGLGRALRLTMLVAKDHHRRFEPTARRFLERFIREEKPSIEQVKKVADGLNEIYRAHPLIAIDAWQGMRGLAEQLERR